VLAALIWLFDANTNALIQLYVIGVFIAFTVSQIGMVRHWQTALCDEHDAAGGCGALSDQRPRGGGQDDGKNAFDRARGSLRPRRVCTEWHS
jgi:hypothetical protein